MDLLISIIVFILLWVVFILPFVVLVQAFTKNLFK